MKILVKNNLWFTVITTLCCFVGAGGCDKMETLPKTDTNVSFTPCQQSEMRSSEFSKKVDVKFISKGVQITHHQFEVTCDFTTVKVTHTFVNGVLSITQQGTPNQANCICYTDVSYTIDGISQDEVNVIFINGEQVYCYNGNGGNVTYKECTHEDDYVDTISIEGVGYLFMNSIPAELQKENNVMYIIHNKGDNSTAFSATYPMDAIYNGNICNFPDFAGEWEIPLEGKRIYYKGELYVTGMYADWPPHTGGDLILTTLKSR